MSGDSTIVEEVQTAGEAGSSTTNTTPSTAATPAGNNSGGFDLKQLETLLGTMLDGKLKDLKPVTPPVAEQTTPGGEVKTYTEEETQKRINAAVRQRLAEKDDQLEKRVETLKGQWLTEISAEFEKQKAVAVQEAIAARDFEQTKKQLQTELGLTDVQLARLQGKSEEELRADATLLGFVRTEEAIQEKNKKTPPAISPGNSTGVADDGTDLAAQVRAGLRAGI